MGGSAYYEETFLTRISLHDSGGMKSSDHPLHLIMRNCGYHNHPSTTYRLL